MVLVCEEDIDGPLPRYELSRPIQDILKLGNRLAGLLQLVLDNKHCHGKQGGRPREADISS